MNNTIVHPTDFDAASNVGQRAKTMLALSEKAEKEAEIKIRQLGDKAKNAGLECTATIYSGKVGAWLPDLIEKNKPMLVVMGTTGAGNIVNKIFGSNTYAIIQNSNSPVLAIPNNVKIKEFSHLVLSTDYKDRDIEAIQFLSRIAKSVKAKIDVLHILNKEGSKKDNNQKLMDNLKVRVEEVETYDNIRYSLLSGENCQKRLNEFIQEEKPDLLTLVMQKQGFFGRLFFDSLTEKMIHHTNIPLLVFSAE